MKKNSLYPCSFLTFFAILAGNFYLILGLNAPISAQTFIDVNNAPEKLKKSYKEAYKIIEKGDYDKGIAQMDKIIKKNPTFVNPYLLVGDLYKQLHEENKTKNYGEQSLAYFQKAVEIAPDYEPRVYYLMGQLYMGEKKFPEAQVQLKKYLAYPNVAEQLKKKAKKMLLDAEFLPQALANPVPYKPINVGKGINTDNLEYFPCVTADENSLIYTKLIGAGSQRQEDLYISKRVNGLWGKGEPIPNVNTPDNEGAQTISANGKTLVFTVCNRMSDFGSCDLYISELKNGKWTTPKNIGAPVSTAFWESQPSLSAHGDMLFFTRGNPRDRGTDDLYMSRRNEKGEWSEPQPLKDINTEYPEQSPFIHPDGQTFYFVSGGYGAVGGNDFYMSQIQPDGSFSKPQNLGIPINSPLDENAITVSFKGNLAYIASDRAGGEGGLDIFQFELPPHLRPRPVNYAEITVYDAVTNRILPNTKLEIINLTDNLPFLNSKTDASGEFLASMPLQKDYALNINRENYLFYSENFALTAAEYGDKPFKLKVYLQPVPKNSGENPNPAQKDSLVSKPIVLKNVFFDPNSAELLPKSKTELDQLKKLLVDNPKMRIRIDGHTDSDGEEEKNKILSQNRAKSVCNYLIQAGIDSKRLESAGFGESRPIDSNDNPQGKANNRRTEFSVLAN